MTPDLFRKQEAWWRRTIETEGATCNKGEWRCCSERAHLPMLTFETLVDLAITQGGLDVFTTNYDLTVGTACSNRSRGS